ncbi:Catechol 2,3-dioxygenase [Curtobacterium sp. UNCCL20]|uniref:VOC family protein n=1 Tax=Curtobacterium sp. UNCCL20 TaxID=1502773 RepID=UPI000888486A|nr:VOC family protein [Curtobacterium sp. UNCCL20]SDQ30912.1 Catechol 2,3-dioxygenase [Curtobacterium sp. UNCCL20]
MRRPPIDGIHHLKLPVSDLPRALAFYERVLGAERIPEADHFRPNGDLFAHICRVDGLGTMLELRLHPVRAVLQRGFDPITVLVPDRAALDAWARHLDEVGVTHSPVLVGIQAWLLVVPDPDGTVLRLYTRETHGPELAADHDSPWLDESVRLS